MFVLNYLFTISWGVVGLVMHKDYYADACSSVVSYDTLIGLAYQFDMAYFIHGVLMLPPVLASWDYSLHYEGERQGLRERMLEGPDQV